eukprot:1159208-Pelagomonas_calceolata.AAC.18
MADDCCQSWGYTRCTLASPTLGQAALIEWFNYATCLSCLLPFPSLAATFSTEAGWFPANQPASRFTSNRQLEIRAVRTEMLKGVMYNCGTEEAQGKKDQAAHWRASKDKSTKINVIGWATGINKVGYRKGCMPRHWQVFCIRKANSVRCQLRQDHLGVHPIIRKGQKNENLASGEWRSDVELQRLLEQFSSLEEGSQAPLPSYRGRQADKPVCHAVLYMTQGASELQATNLAAPAAAQHTTCSPMHA